MAAAAAALTGGIGEFLNDSMWNRSRILSVLQWCLMCNSSTNEIGLETGRGSNEQ